jgi:protein-glucosylgalactosylhydroxylysine glucosidase
MLSLSKHDRSQPVIARDFRRGRKVRMRGVLIFAAAYLPVVSGPAHPAKIDRLALVARHCPSVRSFDPLSPFTVGNGEFAFTVDATGLQSFPGSYADGIPLSTESQWGWHSFPNPDGYRLDETLTFHDAGGRTAGYASDQNGPAGRWLRANPHRLHLGRVGFRITRRDGTAAGAGDVRDIRQTLDLMEGIIRSGFTADGCDVAVETACHPVRDLIAARFQSPLLKDGRLAVAFDFPYGSGEWGGDGGDWDHPDRHVTEILRQDRRSAVLRRTLDADTVFVTIQWEKGGAFRRTGPHSFLLSARGGDRFSFTTAFSKTLLSRRFPDADRTIEASRDGWKRFWRTGGALDLSGSRDPRAAELERRVILSRYLTAVQCAGSSPPQETGLTENSWFGKFHLEMHWWHAAHFVLWGHPELLERSLGWYGRIRASAEKTAADQGYRGARWPKMTSLDGRESPSEIGVFLIWQQPHPIALAELLYRSRPDGPVLSRYRELVLSTAEFMASFARRDGRTGRYILGPPLIPAQEIHKPDSTWNPAFELAYWAYGIRTAQRWHERLGLGRDAGWDAVIDGLSGLPIADGTYQNAETAMNTFHDPLQRKDHPAMLAAFGMLPGSASVDTAAMVRTLEKVLAGWDWESTWGWDYPLIAMTAARCGRPDLAVDALLMDAPKNRYLNNGHNYQNERLPLYLPGNGGLLAAVAMMAAGWDGAPGTPAPGFPKNGMWTVRAEGLSAFP